jgi:hypothetical protein
MPLSADDIRAAFDAPAGELARAKERAEIVVVGGAALVLLFDARASTKDVDAYFVRPAVEPFVPKHQLDKASYAFEDLWEAAHGSS